MRIFLLAVAGLMLPGAALAQSSVTYSYDALGRLVGSENRVSGNDVRTTIDYDPAGNRRTYTVTGAGNGNDDSGANVSSKHGFIVVPLNGFTLIPLN